ncbi:hypothetical protein DNTS_008646 [Danionella cerebrum]|uniref:Uncharacterized protein n=1 Tax=Danionella cerebrum TaxID=2873325 RepID=A0A553RMI5_9TELE|nr:hypothetical protein DNTS_008646 [Danionella translucida]
MHINEEMKKDKSEDDSSTSRSQVICGRCRQKIWSLIPIRYREEVVELLKLAGPVIISQLMIFLISFISTVFCGHLGKTELAVAASVRVGNALGAGNTEQAKLSSKVSLVCGATMGEETTYTVAQINEEMKKDKSEDDSSTSSSQTAITIFPLDFKRTLSTPSKPIHQMLSQSFFIGVSFSEIATIVSSHRLLKMSSSVDVHEGIIKHKVSRPPSTLGILNTEYLGCLRHPKYLSTRVVPAK